MSTPEIELFSSVFPDIPDVVPESTDVVPETLRFEGRKCVENKLLCRILCCIIADRARHTTLTLFYGRDFSKNTILYLPLWFSEQ